MLINGSGDVATLVALAMLGASVGLAAFGLALRAGGLARKRKPREGKPGQALLAAIARVAPQTTESQEDSERALARAGVKMSPQTLWASRLALGAVGVAMGAMLSGMGGTNVAVMAAAAAAGGVVGALLPQVYLLLERKKWQDEIERQLPNALDLLCLTVMAGSTFDAGVRIVSQRTDGALAESLRDVVSMARYSSTTEALGKLAENAGVRTLTIFVASLRQARQSGMSIADILRSQAESIRTTRRLQVEEQINKLPMKMTFPIMIIFVAFMLMIMAPLIASMISTLSQIA